MKHLVLFAALAFATSAAVAAKCPADMRAVDAALSNAKLDAAKSAEVKKLRADGERLHKEGKHADSVAALGKAKGILGVK